MSTFPRNHEWRQERPFKIAPKYKEQDYKAQFGRYAEKGHSQQSWRDYSQEDTESAEGRHRIVIAKTLKIIIKLLLLLAVLQLIFHLVISPRLLIREISIAMDHPSDLGQAQVLKAAGLEDAGSLYYYNLDTALIEQGIRTLAQVRGIEVETVFPSQIRINLSTRTPLGVVITRNESQSIPMVFDAQGVVYSSGSDLDISKYPVASGVYFEPNEPGRSFPDHLVPFLRDLETLSVEIPKLFSVISEVRFVNRNLTVRGEVLKQFEVLLYIKGYSLRVRIGERLDKEKLTNILLVLDATRNQAYSENWEEIDFRLDEPVYRVREE